MNDDPDGDSIVIECFDEFSVIPYDVSRHFKYDAVDCFFSSIEWFTCLRRYGFVEQPELLLYAASNEVMVGHSACFLCLIIDRRQNRLTSLTNYYTIRFPGIVFEGDRTADLSKAIVSGLKRKSPAWSEIELRYLSTCSLDTSRLLSMLTNVGYKVDLFHQYWNWYVCVEGMTYCRYLAERSARVRNTLRRKAKRINTKFRQRFAMIRTASEVSQSLTDYLGVYDRSWKHAERQKSFVPQLIRLCAEFGLLRLGILYLDDKPVAAQFWITDKRVAYIYKLAHDEQYANYSVGSLLTAHMFEHAIDVDKVSEINFGIGDEPFKNDWVDRRRQIVGLQAVNLRTTRGLFLYLRLAIRNILRRLGLRSWTPVELECAQSGSAPAA